MAKQTYIKRDLIDYVTGDIEAPEEGYGGRPAWIVANLPASAAVQYWMQGGYTGKLAFVIRLDGYIWMFNDYYGSCSGCDAFLANKERYVKDMLQQAYCFPDYDAAEAYIGTTTDYSWKDVREPMQKMLDDAELYLQNPKTRMEITKREEEQQMEVVHEVSKDDR